MGKLARKKKLTHKKENVTYACITRGRGLSKAWSRKYKLISYLCYCFAVVVVVVVDAVVVVVVAVVGHYSYRRLLAQSSSFLRVLEKGGRCKREIGDEKKKAQMGSFKENDEALLLKIQFRCPNNFQKEEQNIAKTRKITILPIMNKISMPQ